MLHKMNEALLKALAAFNRSLKGRRQIKCERALW
jgi:hypothetical protein